MATLIARNLKTLKKSLLGKKFRDKNIGLVPTMGAIHNGHLALVKKSTNLSHVTIVTIFLNPIQFNNEEDLKNYPTSLKEDIKILTKNKVDLIFIPSRKEMYPENFSTYINLKKFDNILCGKKRKDHFSGVATVVLKLFSLINPKYAFFGEKDYQQLVIIKKLVKDFNLNVKVQSVKTVRDSQGLALSSRNKLLSTNQKIKATKINKILRKITLKNLKSQKAFSSFFKRKLNFYGISKIEYLEVRDNKSLELYSSKDIIGKSYRVFIAVKIGKVRLIDNFKIGK
ncbi:MAG: Pantothenate synthetase [Alphaproteobacteria bacterium MarineAlpha9_Bin4]|nr:MAG: Pantothenate synthetase [Alphaproteobacteria bacterium MarineAlpha9_Bin4]